MSTTIRYGPSALRSSVPWRALRVSSLLLAGLLGASLLPAQTTAAPPAARATQKTAHRHSSAAKARKNTKAAQAPAPAPPPQPPKPNWPVNDQPSPASVTWDSRGLSIQAKNSSLQQILEDVATATGAKLEGAVTDERVFGDYGPGQAREVVIQLLQGSGYNVVMIGEQGRGAPSRIVLTSRSTGGQQGQGRAAQESSDEDAADSEPEEPPQPPVTPPILRPGFAPGNPMRPPQPMPQQMPQGTNPPNR